MVAPRDRATRELNEAIAEQARRMAVLGDPIVSHLQNLRQLSPDFVGIDVMSFKTTLNTSGVATSTPTTRRTRPGFKSELYAIRGFANDPASNSGGDADLFGLVSFNIEDRQRTSNLFTTGIEMAYLVNNNGSLPEGLKFDRGLYVFDPNIEVTVTFTVDSTYSASAAKIWGVLLVLNMFRAPA
jgi:hypothetical protein